MIRVATLDDEIAVLKLATAFERFGPYRGVFKNMLHQNLPALRMQQLNGEVEILVMEK